MPSVPLAGRAQETLANCLIGISHDLAGKKHRHRSIPPGQVRAAAEKVTPKEKDYTYFYFAFSYVMYGV